MIHPDPIISFLCDIRFHQQFTYTCNTGTTRRISYSDYGDPASRSTVLFFGGLMGSRLAYTTLDQLAQRHHIRIIHPDRPGIGGTTPVPIDERIQTFMDALPRLLAHLGIPHVSLAAHSFGAVYALNVMLLFPQLLHPQRPYVAFFAPWVHPKHTGVRYLQAAGLLPGELIGKFSSVARWVNGSAGVVGMSSGLAKHRESVSLCDTQGGDAGLDLNDLDTIRQLRDLLPTFLFAETLDGTGQDAQLVLRKPRSLSWSTPQHPWDDVDDAAQHIVAAAQADTERTWSVDVFHAETDGLVGQRGRAWFDACWAAQDEVRYDTRVVRGADHDFILDAVFGAGEAWLERLSGE